MTFTKLKRMLVIGCMAECLFAQAVTGPDQTKTGAGNVAAAALAHDSALIQSAFTFLQRQINRIQDANIRLQTADAYTNVGTCVQTRVGLTDSRKDAILQTLVDQELINQPDATSINGGIKAGVFPAVVNDGSNCPTLPMPEYAAPGGATGGHHSYPGGLMVHETFNSISSMNLANGYRRVYGTSMNGLPVTARTYPWRSLPPRSLSARISWSQRLFGTIGPNLWVFSGPRKGRNLPS